MGGYVVRRGRGVDDLVAIPVFLSREFRHSGIYGRRDASIRQPEDLRARAIGVPEYLMMAAVLERVLGDDYGVTLGEIRWVQGGLQEPRSPITQAPTDRAPARTVRPLASGWGSPHTLECWLPTASGA